MATPSPGITSVTSAPTVAIGPHGGRRRQRSLPVTVAVALLSVATLATLAAVASQSPAWLTGAAVAGVLCGWGAARIVHRELARSRRDAAADRAAQAHAYRTIFAQQADEHATFTTSMTGRLQQRERELRQLEGSVVAAQKRATEAEARVRWEAARVDTEKARSRQLAARVEELEAARAALEDARAELAEEATSLREASTAATLVAMDGEIEAVVDLLAWEERVAAAHRPSPEQKQA